jgi:hypothetical protein
LLKAAKSVEPLDGRLARETYLEALTARVLPGPVARSEKVLETARAAEAAPPSSPSRESDLLLDGLALLITEGYGRRKADVETGGQRLPRRGDLPRGRSSVAVARISSR